MRKRNPVLLALVPFILLCAVGCNQSLDTLTKALLATVVSASKERAASFAAISAQLKAKDPGDAPAVAAWIDAHQKGLNAQAASLANLQTAVQAGSSLSQQTRDEITGSMTTAQTRVMLFNAMRGKLDLNDSLSTWADSHSKALQALADGLTQLSTALASQKATAPPKPAPTPTPAK